MRHIRILPVGDRALSIELGTTIDESTHRRVRACCARLDSAAIPGVVEYVPAFASVVVHYDPVACAALPARGSSPFARLAGALDSVLDDLELSPLPDVAIIEIPVCYGGALGPDLEDVAGAHALTPDEVVRLHAAPDYLVYMVGFMPGFAYLGGLDARLGTPRRASPRTRVPAGSVGIGGDQTGVYPMESPGGWHLIGRTPIAMFDAARTPSALLRASDRVRFRPISTDEFRELTATAVDEARERR